MGGWVGVGVEKEVTCESTTGLGENKVSCVRVDMENHVTFVETNFCIRIGCNKVKEPGDLCFGEFSWGSLGSGDFI